MFCMCRGLPCLPHLYHAPLTRNQAVRVPNHLQVFVAQGTAALTDCAYSRVRRLTARPAKLHHALTQHLVGLTQLE